MSDDKRSMKMVALINCVINHNARDATWAKYPGINIDVIEVLNKHGYGIMQMPCPEMDFLGHARKRKDEESILDVLDTNKGRPHCAKLAVKVVDDIVEYRANGYTVAAVLGGDVESPGCAVPAPGKQKTGKWGVFLGAIKDELHRRNIKIPIRGLRDSTKETLQEDLTWLENLFNATSVADQAN